MTDFYHPGDEGALLGMTLRFVLNAAVGRRVSGTVSVEGYGLEDGIKLNLSEKDQKWLGLHDTFKILRKHRG